jgi:Ca2+-binding RTX toxin-like protein
LRASSASRINGGAAGGFSDIEDLIGSTTFDTLTGADRANTWSLTVNNGGNVGGTAFASFEHLTGGADTDAFLFGAGVRVSGRINGAGGRDTLNYALYTTAVQANLATLTATGLLSFSSIEALVGGSSAWLRDTLVGADRSNTWNITGDDAGHVNGAATFSFSSIENLTGGGASDTFAFADGAGVSGTVHGGSGTDTLSFAGYAAGHGITVSVDGAANNAGSVFNNTGDSFTFSSVESLAGGAGDDTFVFIDGRTLSGALNGGGGSDTLDYSGNTTGVRVNLTSGAATGIGGPVSNVENAAGGFGPDILIGSAAANALFGNAGDDILIGLAGNDTLIGDYGSDILIGGNGADTLIGGTGDLLIAGRTNYDLNLAALTSLMAEWGRPDAGYAARIGHLQGTLTGGRNGSYVLTPSTVIGDSDDDELVGECGLDWLLADATTRVKRAD